MKRLFTAAAFVLLATATQAAVPDADGKVFTNSTPYTQPSTPPMPQADSAKKIAPPQTSGDRFKECLRWARATKAFTDNGLRFCDVTTE